MFWSIIEVSCPGNITVQPGIEIDCVVVVCKFRRISSYVHNAWNLVCLLLLCNCHRQNGKREAQKKVPVTGHIDSGTSLGVSTTGLCRNRYPVDQFVPSVPASLSARLLVSVWQLFRHIRCISGSIKIDKMLPERPKRVHPSKVEDLERLSYTEGQWEVRYPNKTVYY